MASQPYCCVGKVGGKSVEFKPVPERTTAWTCSGIMANTTDKGYVSDRPCPKRCTLEDGSTVFRYSKDSCPGKWDGSPAPGATPWTYNKLAEHLNTEQITEDDLDMNERWVLAEKSPDDPGNRFAYDDRVTTPEGFRWKQRPDLPEEYGNCTTWTGQKVANRRTRKNDCGGTFTSDYMYDLEKNMKPKKKKRKSRLPRFFSGNTAAKETRQLLGSYRVRGVRRSRRLARRCKQ